MAFRKMIWKISWKFFVWEFLKPADIKYQALLRQLSESTNLRELLKTSRAGISARDYSSPELG